MSRPDWLRHPRETGHSAWKRVNGWSREALRFVEANRRRLALLVIPAIAVGAGIWILTSYWDWLRNEPDGLESGSSTVRNLGIVIGGVAAAGLAYWRSRVAERQADTAQQSLLNERYQQGAEMLGSKVLSVRLGGIYALERLATEDPEHYHVQIMQLFCAFVRHPATSEEVEAGKEGESNQSLASLPIREDVHAVIKAISVRRARQLKAERDAQFQLDLVGANLPEAWLSGADLSGALLDGANLHRARLSRANLCNALLNDANLSRARLHDADLSGALLDGANLSGALLPRANCSETLLNNANLSRASLRHTKLKGAGLLCSDLSRASLDDANLSGAELSTPHDDYPALGLTQSQLDKARADPHKPPILVDVFDDDTGKPLVWRGQPLAGQR